MLTEKAENHHNQRATLSTKHHGNSLPHFLQLRVDVTLQEGVSRNWLEVMSKEYVFNRNEKEVAILT